MRANVTTESKTEMADCRQCGQAFERDIIVIDGRRLRGAQLCGKCPPVETERERRLRMGYQSQPDVREGLADAGVNVRRHGRCTLEVGTERGQSFDCSESGQLPLRAACEFADEVVQAGPMEAVRGLLLCGPTGTGKTHLAVGICRRVLEAKSNMWGKVVFDAADRFIIEAQDTYGSGQTGAFLERRDTAALWVLDDLGSEKATDDALRLLFSVINRREAYPTVVTTNYAPDELERRWKGSDWWARVASRLAGNFRMVEVGGRDRRFAA